MTHRSHVMVLLAFMAITTGGCRTRDIARPAVEPSVRTALEKQVREWNAGNLAGFMDVYARSEETRFASGGDVTLGWQTVFERYRARYGTGTGMGTLRFSDIEITELAPDMALAFGHWHLKRDAEISSGLFTLVVRNTAAGWRIVHDHTSAGGKK